MTRARANRRYVTATVCCDASVGQEALCAEGDIGVAEVHKGGGGGGVRLVWYTVRTGVTNTDFLVFITWVLFWGVLILWVPFFGS